MPPLHDQFIRRYATWILLRTILGSGQMSYADTVSQLLIDAQILTAIRNTRYLRERGPVLKIGNKELLWEYAKNDKDHHCFVQMLRISPDTFEILHHLIKDDPVFYNNSNNPQAPVEEQLGVTLFRLGRFGNSAGVMDVAREFGIAEGSVLNYTNRCFTAIENIHDLFVRPLTEEEKEKEKQWIDAEIGFQGTWREGYLMYDGTIVVIFQKPGKDGDTYFTRKSNYGFNLQVC